MPLVKLPETSNWDTDINVPDTSDNAYGGINGNMFVGLKSLVNRVLWLKNAIAALSSATSGTNTGDETATTIKTKLGVSTFFAGLFGSADASALRTSILAAPLASPAFTGTPTTPTAAAGTNTTQIANTTFVATAIANLVASSPAALDTLNELAAALGDDPNFATTVTSALAAKQPLSAVLSDFVNSQKLPVLNLANADANSIQQSCIAVVGANVTSLPANAQFLLTNFWNSLNIQQTCYTRENGGILTRRNTGGGWTTWTKSGVEKSVDTVGIIGIALSWNTFRLVSKETTVYVDASSLNSGHLFMYATIRLGANDYVILVGVSANSGTGQHAAGTFIVPSGAYYKLSYDTDGGVVPVAFGVREMS